MLNCHSLCTLFTGTESDHQQVQNVEFPKRYGPLCTLDIKSRKVEAPRNESDEDPQILTTQGIEQFLRNVDIWHEDFIVGTQNPSSQLPSEEFVPRYIYKFLCIMNFHKNIDVPIQILIINF